MNFVSISKNFLVNLQKFEGNLEFFGIKFILILSKLA